MSEEPPKPESSRDWGHGEAWTSPPFNHPIFTQVGLVAARWSYVEQILDGVIWLLIGGDDRLAACLTGQFGGTFQRHNAIIALLEARGHLTKDLRKRIETDRGACNNTSAKRNRIVHDPWFVEVGGAVGAFRTWPKEDLRFGIRAVPQEAFDDALQSINARMDEALQLLTDLLQLLGSHGSKDVG